MKNKDLIKNYYDQLAELQKKYWFEGMETKEYCVRYDAINKKGVLHQTATIKFQCPYKSGWDCF